MDDRTRIKASLSSVRAELAEVFPRLNDDLLGWAPTEGMRTIQGQFIEILTTEQSIVDRLAKAPKRPFEEVEAPFWALKTVHELVESLGILRNTTLAHLDGLDGAAFDAPVEVSDSFRTWLELEEVPASELFRFIARHESYHAGQLVAYLWARGDNPYDWE